MLHNINYFIVRHKVILTYSIKIILLLVIITFSMYRIHSSIQEINKKNKEAEERVVVLTPVIYKESPAIVAIIDHQLDMDKKVNDLAKNMKMSSPINRNDVISANKEKRNKNEQQD